MLLQEINKKWIRYKEYYHYDSPVLIMDVRYDAKPGAEASFDIKELFSDQYILHLNKDIHLYRGEYIDFLLWHEFTHLYDFLTQPFSYNTMRKVYLHMNTWSEYHASRRALGRVLDKHDLSCLDPDKSIIPAAYKDISLRSLISDTLRQAGRALAYYRHNPDHSSFNLHLRYMMYLMGYASHFLNGEDIVRFCIDELKEEPESWLALYGLLTQKEYFKIISHMDAIYKKVGLAEKMPPINLEA